MGGQVWISVPECGIDGRATVLAIGPCPPIPPGPGRVVTGTFRHASAQVLDLHVDGLSEPIGTTANHPFWSEDRQQFLRADELEIGESLRTLHGTARLVATVPRSGTEPGAGCVVPETQYLIRAYFCSGFAWSWLRHGFLLFQNATNKTVTVAAGVGQNAGRAACSGGVS